MRRKRRNHSPSFKAKVALESLKGDRTLSDIADQYEIHPNQIQRWKNQLLENSSDIFGANEKEKDDKSNQIEKLRAKVGELIPIHRESVIFCPKRSVIKES